jgi:hypothetical protein
MPLENTASAASSSTIPAAKNAGDSIQASTFQQMLQILDDLTDHTHVVYDDYTTACNCNCPCPCGRGII